MTDKNGTVLCAGQRVKFTDNSEFNIVSYDYELYMTSDGHDDMWPVTEFDSKDFEVISN